MTQENTLDLRKVKSREYLKKSFWRLLAKKDFSKITIKDISEDSGLNRKTFYRNFEDMDNLMTAAFTDLFTELSLPYACFQESEQITPDLFMLCTKKYIAYIQKEQFRFRLIFQNHLEGFAQVIWKNMFATTASDYVVPNPPHSPVLTDSGILDLYANYAAFAAWGNLEWVLRHADYPLEQLLEQTMKACSLYLHTYYVSYQIDRYFRPSSNSDTSPPSHKR